MSIVAKIFGKGTCVGCSKKGNCECDDLIMVFQCKSRRQTRKDKGIKREIKKSCPNCHSTDIYKCEQASLNAGVDIYKCLSCGNSFNENDLLVGNNGEDIKNINPEQKA